MDYSHQEKALIGQWFLRLDRHGAPYVVLRDYDALPDSSQEPCLDVLVGREQFESAVALSRDCGLQPVDDDGQRRNTSPGRWLRRLAALAGPGRRSREARGESAVIMSRYVQARLGSDNLHFRLMGHLAYISPSSGQMIQVGPNVDRQMLQYRQRQDFFFRPAPPDELVHLICRGVCDRHGDFSEHDIRRCNHLRRQVLDDSAGGDRLKELLSIIFFKAGGIVYDGVQTQQYGAILSRLVAFSGY